MSDADADLDALRTHLRRRAGSMLPQPGTETVPTDRGRRLALAVAQDIGGEPQVSSRPWNHLDRPHALRPVVNRMPILAAAAVSWTLVVALVVAALPGLLARPAPAAGLGESTWYLTNDQLSRVVSAAAATGENVGRTIVANVQITQLQQDCAVGPCGFDTFIAGIEPRIPVTGAGLPAACPAPIQAPINCPVGLPPSGPTALTIEAGSVKFVATLTDRGLAPDKIAYTVAEYLLNRPGSTYVIEGWLWGLASPSCPEAASDSPEGNFGCGAAAWLTDKPPTSAIGPLTAIRVQNDAYPALAPDPGATPTVSPASQYGTYLVTAIPKPDPCSQCDAGAVARLLQPIDTILIPNEVPSPGPATPSADPTGAPTSWLLTQQQLIAAVREAEATGASGPTVVADLAFEQGGDCTAPFNPDTCYPIVKDSDPPIRLENAPLDACPPTWRCLAPVPLYLPRNGPFAVSINADGAIGWVGPVVLTEPAAALDANGFKGVLAALQPSMLDAYNLYAVTGWLSELPGPPKCLLIGSFGCGRAAWISVAAAIGTDVASAPPDSIRVQNMAYETFAPNAPGPGQPTSVLARQGVFLVRPLVPTPTACFECGTAAAEVVARLDPPDTADVVAAPEPSPTVDPMAAYAKSYAVKFEQARATGDWDEAWTLLGPATRAVSGSEARFASQEADDNATGATTYDVAEPTQNPDFISVAYVGAAVWAEIVPDTAWFVGVNHPKVDGASAAFEGLLVASGTDGQWHVWIVH